MKTPRSALDFIVRRGRGRMPKRIPELPIRETVDVFADYFGIPHIFASNEHDLAVAFGYIQAYDRLWQMETMRRLAVGKLSEVLGPALVDVDHWARLTGFPRISANATEHLEDETQAFFLGFVDGVNAYITREGDHLPLEFKAQKFKPEPWQLADLSAPIAYNSWTQQASYKQKMLAVVSRKNLSNSLWKELFPPYSAATYQCGNFFSAYGNLKFGDFIPSSLSLDPDVVETIGGSNNWVTMHDTLAAPILANDPHLGISVPPIWYFAHLSCPTLNVAGAFIAGNPLPIIGRNERVAWSVTNVMTDCTDLVAFRVDPDQPTRYYVGDQTLEMESRVEEIPVAGEASRKIEVFETIHGPVITDLASGIDAAVALKWYGTIGDDAIADSTAKGFHLLARSQSADEAMDAVKHISLVGLNYVFGDSAGNLGRQTTGRIPIRRGYAGNLPVDGSSGDCEWTGFVPVEQMPSIKNPASGWIATANNKIVDDAYPHYITDSWCAPYRIERIADLLDGLEEPSTEVFKQMQLDVMSRQAERLVPGIVSFSYSDAGAKKAAALLADWDFMVTSDSTAALIYDVFLHKFAEVLLEDMLGPGISMFLHLGGFIVNCVDELLSVADRDTTSEKMEILGGRDLSEVCELALAETVKLAGDLCGDESTWTWGNLHRYIFRHLGAGGRISSWLLNRGPFPADGDAATVRVAIPHSGKRTNNHDQYEVQHIQSMRLVTSLQGIDETYIIGPMGQSGRPGTYHYADMLPLYINGGSTKLPLSRSGAEELAVSKHVFAP
jgi:penicillin G amidase